MNRTLRVTVAALALLLLVVGSVLARPAERADPGHQPMAASGQPEAGASEDDEGTEQADEADDAAPSDRLLARLVDRLAAAGVETDAATIAALAADYGVGGAVRVLWFADAAGKAPSDITALLDAGQGWGEIAAALNEADPSLDLRPGIGSIMGNGGGHGGGHGLGLGREHAPGQVNKQQ